jgi:small-conductance mechanosensitive channel
MSAFLRYIILNNTVLNYIISIITFFIITELLYYFKSKGIERIEKISSRTSTTLDDLFVEIIKGIKWFEYQYVAFYIATRHLVINTKLDTLIYWILLIIITFRITASLEKIIDFWLNDISGKDYQRSIGAVKVGFRIFLWIIAILFLLHNANVKIGSLLAGLGIGGVALALAAQTIFGDMFNFFVIVLDKPFKIGDFIVIPSQNLSGTVEEIGLKSTKIRTLSGELLIMTNSKIMSEIIQNFSTMKERRVLTTITVEYTTPLEKLKIIPNIIKEAVNKFKDTKFDRANLVKFNNYSIDFEFVYYILSPDYNYYMSLHEKILNDIAAEFKNNNIAFSYPTYKVYIDK